MAKSTRKERRTFTLSREAIHYIDEIRREQRIESASSALENLIEESRRRRKLARLAASVTDYYSSLSEAQQEEERDWGKFSDSEFSKITGQ